VVLDQHKHVEQPERGGHDDLPYGSRRYPNFELQQKLVGDAFLAPWWILCRHAVHQNL
jgi:hypothetical protein